MAETTANINVKLTCPRVANFIKVGGREHSRHTIPIQDLSDKDLTKVGKLYGEALIARKKEILNSHKG